MDKFTHSSLITEPYQLTYSYYTSPGFGDQVSKDASLPVLMIVHGFPDDAHMWEGAVPSLQKLGYPMLLPDLLGFSGSSKPTDPTMYNYKQQADSLRQVLEKEGVKGKRVIPIGHDWGSGTVQRFFLYHRDVCIGLSLLSLAYVVPSPEHFSLHTANYETSKRFGYPQWAYWEFFCAPDAPEIMRRDLGRFWEVNNGNYPSPNPEEKGRDIWMREMFCVKNGMREYMTRTGKYADGWTAPLKNYPQGEKNRKEYIERMSRDGFEGPVCYYHSLANNTMLKEEQELCKKGPNGEDKRVIDVPLLYIGQTGDWVCRTDLMKDSVDLGLVKDLEEKIIDAGHWCLSEKPEEIAKAIGDWVVKRFPIKK